MTYRITFTTARALATVILAIVSVPFNVALGAINGFKDAGDKFAEG